MLTAIYPGFEEKYVDHETGYSIDWALPSSRIAVEVDGPSHFTWRNANCEHPPNGPTLLKRRLLEAASWHVISVPFYDWDDREGNAEAQRHYLACSRIRSLIALCNDNTKGPASGSHS